MIGLIFGVLTVVMLAGVFIETVAFVIWLLPGFIVFAVAWRVITGKNVWD